MDGFLAQAKYRALQAWIEMRDRVPHEPWNLELFDVR